MDQVATHQRLLIGAAMRTTGTILELGVGWYSTPLLHEIAEAQGRRLITVDNNKHWFAQFEGLESRHHHLHLIGWWGDLHIPGPVGLTFVDNSQCIEREYCIRKLIAQTDVFVMHDTEEGFAYGYERTLKMFQYQWTDQCQKVWTTVASNRVDVTGWFKELPPVEPTEEIT